MTALTRDEVVVLTAAMDILRTRYDDAGPADQDELTAFMGGLEISRILTLGGEKPQYPSAAQRMAARKMLDADARGRI